MYVITGVTGHTGSVVASTLLAEGKPVRVVVRDAAKGEPWKAKGASVAVASLGDRAGFARALAGATGVYLLLPPPPWSTTDIEAVQTRAIDTIVGAISDAKPGHVVLLSSLGADAEAGTGPVVYLHRLEDALARSGVPSTFLRAAYFMENWGGMLKGAIDQGALYYGLRSDLAIPQVATADIGKVAANLLVEGPAAISPRIVDLAGPKETSLADTADAIAEVSGKPVKAVTVPPAAMIDALTGMGASREIAASYAEMVTALNDGRMVWHAPELVRGKATLATTLRGLL